MPGELTHSVIPHVQGFQSHITDNHNMWNYIYYSVYVEDTPVRDRTAIQTYIYEMVYLS